MTKVLVVGGGIAGYCAALAARRERADVTVIARAPGATALYAGGMEIVDDLEAILSSQHHPLARLGLDTVGLATELDAAISTLQLALGKEGLTFEGGWRTRGLYADIHGLARPANVVPQTVARGELGALTGKRVAVIGIPQVGDQARSRSRTCRRRRRSPTCTDAARRPLAPAAPPLPIRPALRTSRRTVLSCSRRRRRRMGGACSRRSAWDRSMGR